MIFQNFVTGKGSDVFWTGGNQNKLLRKIPVVHPEPAWIVVAL